MTIVASKFSRNIPKHATNNEDIKRKRIFFASLVLFFLVVYNISKVFNNLTNKDADKCDYHGTVTIKI